MKKRIITGIIASIPLIVLVFIGGVPFTVLTSILALLVTSELLRMKNIVYRSPAGIIAFLFTLIVAVPEEWLPWTKFDLSLFVLIILFCLTVISKNRYHFDDISFVFISSLYAGFGFYYMMMTRMLPDGLVVLLFVLLVIWSTDSGAYFVGRKIGKRKLWPEISPNKTIEGAGGGILSAVVIASLFQTVFPLFLFPKTVLIAVVISVFAQIGDLVESALKRHYGVKDSGHLLPGHGGILDRCDSWIFVFPILHLFQLI